MLGLELGDRHLLGPDGGHIVRHRFRQLGVGERADPAQAFDLPLLLAGDAGEQFAALDDLGDGLAEVDRDPFVFAARAGAFEDFADTVGIVSPLQSGLALRAQAAVDERRRFQGGAHGQVRHHGPRAVGAAVNFGQHAVLQFALDAATCVAVEADRIEDVLRIGEVVGGVRALAVEQGRVLLAGRGQRGDGTGGEAEECALGEEGAAGGRGNRGSAHVWNEFGVKGLPCRSRARGPRTNCGRDG